MSAQPRNQRDDEPPLRAELFSADQMALHGKALAASHKLAPARAPDRLLARLAANESALVEVCSLLTEEATESRRITPAGEWLLDNFYLIEEQIRTAKRHLPKGYSRELPRLAQGPSAGRPRVYDIALETIAHGDGRVDTEGLSRFVAAYQSVTALRLGELWAIPIMLRLALIENLRRVGVRIAVGRAERNLAGTWADQMSETAEKDPKSLILVIADMARSNPPMVSAFVAELARRLQGRGPALALPLTWIEQRLSESGLTIEQLIQSENQQQAASQVSISNSIGSLRILGATDWREFVETMSVVEQALREDPAGAYGRMDFVTRDRYRHATESMAKRSPLSEGEVARTAIRLARAAAESGAGDRAGHVGYYLIDKGVRELERAAQVRSSGSETLRRTAGRFPLLLYVGAIALIAAIISGSVLAQAHADGVPDWLLWSIGILSLLAASQLAVALVNWLATLLVTPHPLPRLDFSAGIPAQSRTLVVVPTMLSSAQNVEDLTEALEVTFLANRDERLHFGLLTDFRDTQQESLPGDGPLVQRAQARIDELNAKYGAGGGRNRDDIFFLFHRPRRWNPRERLWMGYERKRGKLADLNALLRGGSEDRFSLVIGDTALLSEVKYVITLDTDTQLPRDAARQFVGAMAHPLNRPRYDATKRRVVEGYGILQPRVAASLSGTNRSRYARLYGGEPGIDPYTRAVSDVYQDVFGEGSFIGKGIYDVDAFEQAIGGRLPENRILSHDLLEGCYARAGLLSDVRLYEDYPPRYRADVSRRYRWIRGDWQLAGWLRGRVPGGNARRHKNPLSWLSQWKLFDNLRRSVVPAALVLLLLLGWTVLPRAWLWTSLVIGIMLLPSLCASIVELLRKSDEVLLRQHLASVAHSAWRHFMQMAFELACLPYEAFYSLDAIARTAWRMLVVRRGLLEWNPSGATGGEPAKRSRGGLAASFRSMWVAPAIAAAAATHLAAASPAALALAAPILLLWFASPVIAWWFSRPLVRRKVTLTREQTRFLRELARRTWAFFETFVGPEDHWLPPDNYQEYRVAAVVHRTSPTNMGLALLANLSAYDFGYLPAGQLIERTAKALHTMQGLERHRGHYYNWYDTQTLQPLPPLYISTVDSGNLAGHLLTLRAGLLALADDRILPARLFDGLSDTLGLLGDAPKFAQTTWNRRARRRRGRWPRPGTASSAWPPGPPAEPPPRARRAAGRRRSPANAARRWTSWRSSPRTSSTPSRPCASWRRWMRRGLPHSARASARARDRMAAIERLAQQCGELARMEYDFLFDRSRQLLTIGYNVSERRADPGYYDLLASEARLCSFVAIAQGQLPQESWFALGRLLTSAAGEPVLLSWSGSMFEYLMPLLVMPSYDNTLLDQTCKAAVARQIEYGSQRGVPWGMSESGYNTVDVHLNYQYRAFGVPGLGLKRGLADDLVVAPYASALALTVAPEKACLNLQRLAAEGFLGKFGFFEAIDYTPARQRRGQSSALVHAFMAHHQGMSLLALAHLLLERPMQRRFESEPLFQSVMLLLQERVPKATALFPHTARTLRGALDRGRRGDADSGVQQPRHAGPRGAVAVERPLPRDGDQRGRRLQPSQGPRRHTLARRRHLRQLGHVLLPPRRGERSVLVDRLSADARAAGELRSDLLRGARRVSPPRCRRRRRWPYRNACRDRRIAGGRHRAAPGPHHRSIATAQGDRRHELRRSGDRAAGRGRASPGLQRSFRADRDHARAARDPVLSPAPLPRRAAALDAPPDGGARCGRRQMSYETDRARFIGRARSTAAPLAMSDPAALSGSEGSVLDPIVAIRCRVTLEPDETTTIDMVSASAIAAMRP